MATNIELPELGDGIESGEVSDVLVSEGDVIEKGQGLVEIESDKASVVVPTEIAGTVVKLCVAVGDTIAIGGVIAQVEESAAPATSIPLEPASSIDAPSPEAPEPSNPTPP
ncbi:MAG: biotin/lipoyl-containing protein, partial [Pirellulaceae bacterium]